MTYIDDKIIKQALERPSDFGYSGDLDLFNTWGLCGPAMTRDSKPLEISNFETIRADMEERYPDDVDTVSASHWGVGWIDQLAVRVLDKNGSPTAAFEALMEWNSALQEYPVADETDYSRREYEDCIESIEQWYLGYVVGFDDEGNDLEVIDDLPDDYATKIFSYLFDNFSICSSEELENDKIVEAYKELGFLQRIDLL